MAGFSHDPFDRFLARHVDGEGRLDYARAGSDRADLDRYLAAIRATSPDSDPARFPHESDRLAYWINAYNASVIDLVLARYPLASVIDVKGPFLARILPEGAGFFLFEKIVLGGRTTRLYWLENTLIRRRFADPRIHFALNCASASCPRLPAEAFQPDRLEAQLAREATRFLGEARNVSIDAASREVRLSAIFDWYTKDFRTPGAGRGQSGTLRAYLRENLAPDARGALEACADCTVRFFDYDWSLNDQANAPG